MLAYCVVIFQAYFIFMPHLKLQTFNINFLESWNNGKEVPRWGVAEIQEMSPSTTERCK